MGQLLSFLFGVVLVAVGVYGFKETLQFRREGAFVAGNVVAVKTRLEIDEDGFSIMQRPVVEFVPAGTRSVQRFTSSVSSSWPWSYDKGDVVTVNYIARDPSHARIDGWLVNWIGPLLCLVLGAWVAIKRPALDRHREVGIDLD